MSKKGRSQTILSLLRIAVGLALLVAVLSRSRDWDPVGFIRTFAPLLPLIALMPILGTALESLRLGTLLKSQGVHLPFGKGCRLVAIATFFNFFVPGGTGGDLMKLYYIASDRRGTGIETATVLLIDRAAGLYSLLILVAGLGVASWALVAAHSVLFALWCLAVAALAGISALTVMSGSLSSWLHRRREGSESRRPLHTYGVRLIDAVLRFKNRRASLILAVLYSFAGHAVLCLIFLLMGSVRMPDTSGFVVCLLSLMGMLANALPFTPGGIGVGEAAFEGLFVLAGSGGGAQLMVAYRIAMLPVALAGGVLYGLGVRRGSRGFEGEGRTYGSLTTTFENEPETRNH